MISSPWSYGSKEVTEVGSRDQEAEDIKAGETCEHRRGRGGGASEEASSPGRRDSDEKVERQINLHFGWMSKVARSTKRVGGLTLRDRIHRDRAKLRASAKGGQEKKLGPKYWTQLAGMYGAGVGDFTNILPEEGRSLPVSHELTESLEIALSHDCRLRSPDPLNTFL